MGDGIVVTSISRPDHDVVAGLEAAGVATVHEAAGGTGLLRPEIRPIQEGVRIAGPAVTVSCAPGDNIMIHAAVEVIEAGDVLVVATTAESNHGMFGDLLATSVLSRGCRGLIMDAGVRDVSTLREIGFPVWSRVVHAQSTTKTSAGSVNLPVVCSGVSVSPGDIVVADDDGVMVVEAHRASEVLEAARQRLQKEDETRAQLESGALGLDIYGFRKRLEDLGVRWVDTPEG